jgi:flagellar basal body P-ring formation protein FlgA
MKRLLRISVMAMVLLIALLTTLHAADANVLNEAKVRQIVVDYLQQKTRFQDVTVQLKKLGFSGEILLPAGNATYEVVSPQEWEGWGRGALALIVRIDDRVVKNIPLNVEVEALTDVVVATRAMERGMVVEKGDVALLKRDMATVPAKTCRNLNEVLGKRVRVGIRGNSPVRSDYLERLPIIKSGQLVTIVAENDKFRITATGKAKGNGAEGETVVVQNLNAQKELSAIVMDAKTVRVEF